MDAKDYQAQAPLTLSGGTFHGHKVTMAALTAAMRDAVKAGDGLDKIKKALFYGRGADIGLTMAPVPFLASEAPALIAGITRHPDAEPCADAWSEADATVMLHMAIGKVTEAAEFLDAILSCMNGKSAPPDRVNLLEELGDGLWYDANALNALGSSFADEFARNNAKLRLRFPHGFTEHDANNRNLAAERALLEGEPYPFATDPVDEYVMSQFGEDPQQGFAQDVDPNAPGYAADASPVYPVGNSETAQ